MIFIDNGNNNNKTENLVYNEYKPVILEYIYKYKYDSHELVYTFQYNNKY